LITSRFLSYLIAALQTIFPDIGSSALALLHSLTTPPLESLLTMLSNELTNREEGNFVLVLDDYHVIADEAIHIAKAHALRLL
jgi:LuxR family transcriptional regulator, maltose regulon positive regulatory protein